MYKYLLHIRISLHFLYKIVISYTYIDVCLCIHEASGAHGGEEEGRSGTPQASDRLILDVQHSISHTYIYVYQ